MPHTIIVLFLGAKGFFLSSSDDSNKSNWEEVFLELARFIQYFCISVSQKFPKRVISYLPWLCCYATEVSCRLPKITITKVAVWKSLIFYQKSRFDNNFTRDKEIKRLLVVPETSLIRASTFKMTLYPEFAESKNNSCKCGIKRLRCYNIEFRILLTEYLPETDKIWKIADGTPSNYEYGKDDAPGKSQTLVIFRSVPPLGSGLISPTGWRWSPGTLQLVESSVIFLV